MLAGEGAIELSILDAFETNYNLLGLQASDLAGNPLTIQYNPINTRSGLWKIDPPRTSKAETIVDALVELNNGMVLHLPVKDKGGVNQNLATATPIGSADELARIRGGQDYPLSWYFVQYTDVDLTSRSPWTPLGVNVFTESFTGIFDGGEKTIRGLNIQGASPAGLFGSIGRGGIARNINIMNSTIKGGNNTGGICGELKGRILNCTVSASVSGQVNTGGITGSVTENAEIIDTSFFGFVNSGGKSYTGGITGFIDGGIVRDSDNSGMIQGGDNTGGITGGVKSKGATIIRGVNKGFVKGAKGTGGIAGSVASGIMDSCDNSGEINGEENIGGIAGWAGGIKIYANRNTGAVKASSDAASGIVGYLHSGEVYACYNTGRIESADISGGIVGFYRSAGKAAVAACYSTGKIISSQTGAIIGHNDYVGALSEIFNKYIVACYWLDLKDGNNGSGMPNTNIHVKPFGDTTVPPLPSWPSPLVHIYWSVRNASAPDALWKDLGSWNGTGIPTFPKLYWE